MTMYGMMEVNQWLVHQLVEMTLPHLEKGMIFHDGDGDGDDDFHEEDGDENDGDGGDEEGGHEEVVELETTHGCGSRDQASLGG